MAQEGKSEKKTKSLGLIPLGTRVAVQKSLPIHLVDIEIFHCIPNIFGLFVVLEEMSLKSLVLIFWVPRIHMPDFMGICFIFVQIYLKAKNLNLMVALEQMSDGQESL